MAKTIVVILAVAITAFSAEIPSSYTLPEQHPLYKPEAKPEVIETHSLNGPNSDIAHPVFRPEEVRNQGRARIEPVRPIGPVIKHDGMLADQPAGSTEINRVDDLGIFGNGYIPASAEVAYPDIQYAPGYLYDSGYAASNNYEMYGPNTYLMEPDTSAFGLLWSQVPYGRTLVSFVGRTIAWFFNSIFVLFLGSLLTIGVCSYTNLCTIAFHGVGPIHEEMRALITPERLEKISSAADFVKTAINKYQKIQKITDDGPNMRRRRAVFSY